MESPLQMKSAHATISQSRSGDKSSFPTCIVLGSGLDRKLADHDLWHRPLQAKVSARRISSCPNFTERGQVPLPQPVLRWGRAWIPNRRDHDLYQPPPRVKEIARR